MFKGISSRGLSSSDLTNVSKVNFVLTWATFQEVPAVKIDFKNKERDKNTEISKRKAATTALNAL